MPSDLIVTDGLVVAGGALTYSYTRSGGPGGQHVNTTDTRVRLHVDLARTGLPEGLLRRLREAEGSRITADDQLVISSDRHRSQHRNVEDVNDRLRELVLAHRHAPRRRVGTKPTRSSQRRRMQAKRHRGQIKAGRQRPSGDD